MPDIVLTQSGEVKAIVPETGESKVVPRPDIGVTARVCVLCLGLAIFFGMVIPVIDVKLGNTFLSAQHLPPGAIGTLLVFLLLVNPLLRWVSGQKKARAVLLLAAVGCGALAFYGHQTDAGSGLAFWAGISGVVLAVLGVCFSHPLSRNELLTIYISCLFSCLVPGHGSENFVVSNLIAPFYFSTADNSWFSSISPYIPSWATPVLWADPSQHGATALSAAGREVASGFYLGGVPIPWSAWLVPMGFWILFISLSYIMLGSLSILLRAQWGEYEALSFPLNQLALELTEDTDRLGKRAVGSFFHNPLMWMGFSAAVIMQGLNGLNLYFPDFPRIEWNVNTGPLFSDAPWNQMGWTPIQIYPVAIGLAFLLTSEVGFSLWAFALIIRFQYIGAYMVGFPLGASGGRDFTNYQIVGAACAYAVLVLWAARAHLFHVVRRSIGLDKPKIGEAHEVVPLPIAFWTFVLSTLGVLGLSRMLGMTWSMAIILWGTYFLTAIGMTRLIVEGGMLYVGNSWRILDSIAVLGNASPATWFPLKAIAPSALVQGAFMTDMRAFIMPSFVQGFKLAHDNGLHKRRLLALMAAITLLTLIMGFWMRIRLSYEAGALGFHPFFAKNGSVAWAQTTKTLQGGVTNVSWGNWFWLGVGIAATWAMIVLRSRFAWFPLHPLGYIIPLSYPITCLWFSIFCGWTAKSLVTRFGGPDTYRQTRPLFLGLAFGDISMMLFWLLIDGWQGRTMHYLVPT